jgi:LacI family transcriptional regulator
MKQSGPSKPPTLVHVARLAGVGIGTASRVLNHESHVSEKAAARVVAAMEQLGYKPNEVARNLKVRRSGAVGLIVPDIGGPFMADCVHAIHLVLREHGYVPILAFSHGDSKTEAKELDYLVRRQIDGLIVVPSGTEHRHFKEKFLEGTPIVAFDQPIPGRGCDAVLLKNKESARMGVEHLLGHGHRRIACVGVFQHTYTIKNRLKGYLQAMAAAGFEPDVTILDPGKDEARHLIAGWFEKKQPPTAIFSLNEWTSVQILHATAAQNISMPDSIAMLSFDDVQLGELLQCPLTAIRQPASDLGTRAASLLVQRMTAKAETPVQRITLAAELIIRRSCGCNGKSQERTR